MICISVLLLLDLINILVECSQDLGSANILLYGCKNIMPLAIGENCEKGKER